MYTAEAGYLNYLPSEFLHSATHQDNYGRTVAMHAAGSGRIKDLPREFYHDPYLKDNNG